MNNVNQATTSSDKTLDVRTTIMAKVNANDTVQAQGENTVQLLKLPKFTNLNLIGVRQFRQDEVALIENELTTEELDAKIAGYEKKFGITSETLLRMDREGTVPDKFEYGAWLSWLRARGY